MPAEERKVPPMSFVAQMLRDDQRLAELSDERNEEKPLFSSTAIAIVLMLASHINRRTFKWCLKLTTLARECRLNAKSIRRYRAAIEVFFSIEDGEVEDQTHTYRFKSPEEYEQDVASLMADCNADRGSTTPDRGSTHKGRTCKEPEKTPEKRTLPRRGSAVPTPSGVSEMTRPS